MSMQSILAASQSITRMQTIQSARTQMQGTANVLRVESKQDGGNEKKDAKASELEEKSSTMMGDLMEEVSDINETLKPDEDTKEEEKETTESKEKEKREDKVTLSDIAAGYRGPLPKINPTMGKMAAYNADGSKEGSVLEETTPTFETTA